MTHSVEHSGDILTKRYASWSRGEPTREWAALTLLSRETSDLVPTPLSSSSGGTPWVSMTVLPGRPLAGTLGPRQLDALGKALETLWSISPDGLPPIDLGALINRTRIALTGMRSADGVIGEAARAWLTTDPLDDIQDPVVAHGDPNLANYLWDGSRVRIVDFEDAGRGDRTVELANLVEHLAGRQTDWSPVVRRFDVDPERLRAARSLWAGFWLTLIGPGGPSADRNPPGTAEAQARRVLRLAAGAS
ncbi:aminoglycoside phosphotransferase family protein [Kribbella sp. NPDC051952]|uniref:phosphotransferase family protein n=1 Tax=Kribbella sp. NPDC051952 TaxID=3154851 RepID=UPI00342AFF42